MRSESFEIPFSSWIWSSALMKSDFSTKDQNRLELDGQARRHEVPEGDGDQAFLFAVTQLELDGIGGDGDQAAFGDLFLIAHPVAQVGALAEEAAKLIRRAQRPLRPRRGYLELVVIGEQVDLIEQRAERMTDPLAVVERHALRPVDHDPQQAVTAAAG